MGIAWLAAGAKAPAQKCSYLRIRSPLMGLSLNTNVGAFVALQNLTKTTQQLEQTQLRITTGLRVNGPKDDGANYAISQKI